MYKLSKSSKFNFSVECLTTFVGLKKKLTEVLLLISPDWEMYFELMCDASDIVVREILGQSKDKIFHSIYYSSKTFDVA